MDKQFFWNYFLNCFSFLLQDCDWIPDDPSIVSSKDYVNRNWSDRRCLEPYSLTLIGVSALALFPFVIISLLSAVMHINDPKSVMILARAHSRVDILELTVNLLLTAIFVFFKEFPGWLAASYIVGELSIFTALTIFQPYYHHFTNDLYAGISATTVWCGLSFAALSSSQANNGPLASLMLFCGFLPAGLCGFMTSRLWRKFWVTRALKKYASQSEVALVRADDFFEHSRSIYENHLSTSIMQVL